MRAVLLDVLGQKLCRVARRAIAAAVRGETFELSSTPSELRFAVFVTLRTAGGKLRGCIGSLAPVEADLFAETRRSAVLAATRDPRFLPVRPEELESLWIEVSVLMPEERVESASELDPQRYGVVVRDGAGRRGLLLPEIAGIHDARAQIAAARHKAGIAPDAPITLSRFEVRKFRESVGAAGIEPATSSV